MNIAFTTCKNFNELVNGDTLELSVRLACRRCSVQNPVATDKVLIKTS